VKTLVFLLEEPSAREMLEGLRPRLLPSETDVRYVVFRGKQDLEKNLHRKLRGWLTPECVFVILRDQDAGDCREIKRRLIALCKAAPEKPTLVRIACHELESFYLGDLAAVERGLGVRGLARRQRETHFRDPDSMPNPAQTLGRLTDQTYQKVLGSRAIGPHLDLEKNASRSFQALISGIRTLVAAS
jgi:hypothetical protein